MPAGVVSVGVLADFAQLIEQSDAAGMSIEAFSGKVITSSRQASRAMVDLMKTQGATADEMKVAAAEVAGAWDKTYGQLSKGAKSQADASLMASRAAKESAAQQSAAYAQTAAAARDLEVQQKAAADAAAVSAAKMSAAAEASAARVAAASKKISSVGKWALFGGAAGVALAVKGAADLQTSMERLHTQAGVSQSAIKGLTGSVLNMAGSLATAPNVLAQSLYHVESGGIHGAESLKVMATAAKEAKISGADLTDTTTALTATVYSGIQGAQNYAKAMGVLNATVGAGDMTFQNLNEALGTPMLATVKGYGLSLKDVGAALATFGDLNIRGADAATQLRMAVQYMAHPAQTAGPILQKLGLSVNSLGDAMQHGGLLPALQLLHDKLVQAGVPVKAYGQVMADIFNRKGAAGITNLENSLTKLESKYKTIGASTNQVNQGWTAWNKTLAADLDHLRVTVEVLADKFGTYLLPKMEAVAHAASDVIAWLQKNKGAAEALGAVIAGVLGGAIAMFVTTKTLAFINGLRGMGAGVAQLAAKLPLLGSAATTTAGEVDAAGTAMVAGADTTAAGVDAAIGSTGIGLVVVGLGVAAMELATHWSTAMHAVESVTQTVMNDVVLPIINHVISAINTASSALNTMTFGLVGGGQLGKLGNVNLTGPSTAQQLFNAANQRVNQGSHNAANLSGIATGEVWQSMGKNFHNAWGGHKELVSAAAVEQAAKADHMSLREYAKKTGINWGSLQSTLKTNRFAANYKTSAFPSTENQFIQALSRLSGLNPAVLAGWANSEQPPGQPANAANPYNFLNIGESGSTYRGSVTNIWSNPTTAAEATYQWIKTGGGVPGWKGPGVPSILSSSTQSTAQQISAIQGSGWVTGNSNQISYPGLAGAVDAVLGRGQLAVPTGSTSGSPSILSSIQNLGTGAKIPTSIQYEAEKSRATQLSDQANKAQAVGQAQVTLLQAINQQLTDRGAALVQRMSDLQARITDRMTALVTSMKDRQQAASDQSAALVTQAKDQQAITDQESAIQVQAIKDQTTVIQDTSAIQVAAIQGMAQKIADASNAAATLIGDNAQTNADTISERGLYGLNLVAQKLQVQADIVKAGFDAQIAKAQATLDNDQMAANVANAQAQLATDQVTATQNMNVLQAQQNLNLVTLKQNGLVAKAQAHLDAVTLKQNAREDAAKVHLDTVTMRQDAKANAAKAHMDAITISQDQRILKATQHADAVQLSVDVTKIGPAQTAVDMSANASKTVQNEMQAQLQLATAQGNVQINSAQLALAQTTSSAQVAIAGAQNAYQQVQNTANVAIQSASNQYANAQNAANQAIQSAQNQYATAQDVANQMIQAATNAYQTQQDAANAAIASAQQSQANTAAGWASQLAADQLALSGVQGQAATGEATAQGAVTNEQALASTQFAGSGLTVNVFNAGAADPTAIGEATSWAIRSSGLAA